MPFRIRFALALLAVAGTSACATAPPGVTACYWSKLVHPTMDPVEPTIGVDGHVRAVSEGATTAPATAAGGK